MPERHSDISQQPGYVALAQSMREVPDLLIAAQLSLRPLAKGEAPTTTSEARQIVGDACDLLHLALANVLEVTRTLPELAPASAERADPVETPCEPLQDRRMSPREGERGASDGWTKECALTTPFAAPFRALQEFTRRLTDEELDRLYRCSNGNTLRFEASEIVGALVAGGYATEGPGRVVTVTHKGYRYLRIHASRLRSSLRTGSL